MTPQKLEALTRKLQGTPVDLSQLGDLPATAGIYAWWIKRGALEGLPSRPHPSEPDWDLAYIGISPAREGGEGSLRSRVLRQHLNGTLAESTLRRTLASLVFVHLGLRLIASGMKVELAPEHKAVLTTWQRENMRLTWIAIEAPWQYEAAVIATLRPPLNAEDGGALGATLLAARSSMLAAARPPAPKPATPAPKPAAPSPTGKVRTKPRRR